MPKYETSLGVVETEEWGQGDKRTLLFHSAGSGPRALTSLANSLAQSGRQVIAPALDGYAATRVRGGSPVLRHLAVAQWAVEYFGNGAVELHLFGHSMGGLIALLSAAANAKCTGVTVFDPIMPGLLDPEDPADAGALDWDRRIVGTLVDAVERGDPASGVRAFIEAWNDTPWDALPPAVRVTLEDSAARLAHEAQAVSYFTVPDPFQMTPGCSVTLLHGGHSPPVVARMIGKIRERITSARVQVVPGAGHMWPVAQGRALAPLIL